MPRSWITVEQKLARDKYRCSPKGKETARRFQRRANIEKFGLTEEQHGQMLLAQNGRCAICGQEETAHRKGRVRNLCIAHCHTTSQVRGLLCSACNTSIGKMQDNPTRLRDAADYIEKGGQ